MKKRCIKKSKKSNQTNNLQKTTCAKICMPNKTCEQDDCFTCKNNNCKDCPISKFEIHLIGGIQQDIENRRTYSANCVSDNKFKKETAKSQKTKRRRK